MAQAESLLKALNVTDEDALANLLQYFLKDVAESDESKEEEDDDEDNNRQHTIEDMPEEVKQLQVRPGGGRLC